MGWYSSNLDRKDVKKWYIEGANKKVEILKVCIVNFKELYAAVKIKETNQIFCVVLMLDFTNYDGQNFSYKPLSEFSGPYMYNCPESIFKLLTPLEDIDENCLAIEWRKKVSEHIKKSKQIKGNCIIKVDSPLLFKNKEYYQYFKKDGKKIFGGKLDENNKFITSVLVRLSFKDRNFEVINI